MALAEEPDGAIQVSLAYSPVAGTVQCLALTLPAGATVAQAIQLSGWALPEGTRVGVWGRLRALTDPLRDRDRVECYRPLTVDPKEARRQRYRSHRKAGAR
jgi:putative ubiquitin-RnfH superfamily antitoxin RatB of RatAB toxin-antitoxin module